MSFIKISFPNNINISAMKKTAILASCIIASVITFAGNDEQSIESKIKQVKVFRQGAQILRETSFTINQGRSDLVLKNLPLNIDSKTIRIKSNGDFYILSVMHRRNFLKGPDYSEEIRKLDAEKKHVMSLLESEERRLSVFRKQESLISVNIPKADSKEDYWALDELKNLVSYFGEQFNRISTEILESERIIKGYKERISVLSSQMASFGASENKSVSEIVIQLFANKPGKGSMLLQYITPDAGWKPTYDLRVKNLNDPLTLSYKAEITQNTGENWDNVKLTLSTKNPYASERLQTLIPWFIEPMNRSVRKAGTSSVQKPNGIVYDYQKGEITGRITDQDGNPLPGANILIKGTTTGTVSDIDGRFSIRIDNPGSKIVCNFIGYDRIETDANSPIINFMMAEDMVAMEEVVVVGYGSRAYGSYSEMPPATETEPDNFIIKDQEDMDENYQELDVLIPYSIPSDGKEYTAVLTDLDIESDYIYKCVPKLNRDVFLHARISGYGKYMLKPGNAGLFHLDTYLGKMDLNFHHYEDTLDISFGNDEKIIVKREKLSDEEQARALSASRTIEKNFKITVKNNKNEMVKIQLQDQYPVATKDYIQSEPVIDDHATSDEKTGIITWDLELRPYEEKEILFGYRIKFPKSKKIIQE